MAWKSSCRTGVKQFVLVRSQGSIAMLFVPAIGSFKGRAFQCWYCNCGLLSLIPLHFLIWYISTIDLAHCWPGGKAFWKTSFSKIIKFRSASQTYMVCIHFPIFFFSNTFLWIFGLMPWLCLNILCCSALCRFSVALLFFIFQNNSKRKIRIYCSGAEVHPQSYHRHSHS